MKEKKKREEVVHTLKKKVWNLPLRNGKPKKTSININIPLKYKNYIIGIFFNLTY